MQAIGRQPNPAIRALDGAYPCDTEGEPVFVEMPPPTDELLQMVLHKFITRMVNLLTRRVGGVGEVQAQTYMADDDSDAGEARTLRPLEDMQRMAALVPRPRLHLIRFGVFAPKAKLRALVVPQEPEPPAQAATLLKRVFEINLEHCRTAAAN